MFTEATGNCKRYILNRFVEFLLNFFSRIFFCSDDLQKSGQYVKRETAKTKLF